MPNVITDPELNLLEAFSDRLLPPGEHGLLGAHYGGGDAWIPLLRDYVLSRVSETASTPVPTTCHREYPGISYGMLGNDVSGDCVLAQIVHAMMHLLYGSRSVGAFDLDLLTKLAIDLYSTLTGYVPGEEDTDQGTDPVQAYAYWRSPGIEVPHGAIGGPDARAHRDKVLGVVQILPHDGVNVRRAIYEFDVAGISLALPLAWQRAGNVWDVAGDYVNDPDWQPGGWGGHQVLGVSYTPQGIAVVTWGGIKVLTWRALGTYGQLILAAVTRDQLSKGGRSETGLALTALERDLSAL